MGSPARAKCAALALLAAGAALADDPPDAKRYLDAAKRLYADLEYERALEQLGKARRLSLGVDLNVQISLYEGIVLCELNRQEDARAAFESALYLQPTMDLPVPVSPKVQEFFDAERRRIQKELVKRKSVVAASAAEPIVREEPTRPSRAPGIAVTAAGGAVAVAGGVCLLLARQDYQALTGGPPIPTESARQTASQGQGLQVGGDIALAVGLGAAVVGTGMLLFAGDDAQRAWLVPTGSGMAVVGSFR